MYLRESSNPSPAPEVDVLDVAVAMMRRWRILAACMTVALLAGLALAMTREDRFTFTTIIEVGSFAAEGERIPFESQQTVLSKLEESFIPVVVGESGAAMPAAPAIQVSAPDESIVRLSSKATEGEAASSRELHERVAARLILDHDRHFNVLREKGARQLLDERGRLDAIAEQFAAASADVARLEARHDARLRLFAEELSTLAVEKERLEAQEARRREEFVARVEALRQRRERLDTLAIMLGSHAGSLRETVVQYEEMLAGTIGAVTDRTDGLAAMAISAIVQQSRSELSRLRERVEVEIPIERAGVDRDLELADLARAEQEAEYRLASSMLEGRIAQKQREREDAVREYQRDRSHQDDRLAALARERSSQEALVVVRQAELEGLQNTRILSLALRSAGPTGVGDASIILISVLLGFLAAIFLMFVAELAPAFAARWRKHDRLENQTPGAAIAA